jgi:hypothetical protein
VFLEHRRLGREDDILDVEAGGLLGVATQVLENEKDLALGLGRVKEIHDEWTVAVVVVAWAERKRNHFI